MRFLGLMLARSFDRASKSTIDASVGAQEFVDAIRDATRNFYRAPKVLRHHGTCYKAANWINIGQTTGRGKKSSSHRQLIPVKDIGLYPLRKNFASVLCS